MADAVVKLEKIYANRSVKLLFGDKDTIKINGTSKETLPTNSTFSVSVNWGDGKTETITDVDQIQHMYGSAGQKTIIVTGGWSDSSGNRYLSFPKNKVTRINNTYIRPWEKQTLTIKDGYLCIKFKGDYIGLSSENTIRVKKGQENKFVNKTGKSITVNDTIIANNETSALITMPNSGTPTITGTGFNSVTLSLEDAYNADGTGLFSAGKFKIMLTSNHLVYGNVYARKKYTIGKVDDKGDPVMTTGSNPTQDTQIVKLVPGNKLAKRITVNGNFKLHGTGDFAFFDKLQLLKYDRDVGGETGVGHAKQYQALEVIKFEYTFAGCMNLGGSSSLLKKIWCKPYKMTGTFSGMSTELNKDSTANWAKPPTFRGNFKNVVSIDYMAESSNFDVDISAWNFSENKITSAVGFAQNSSYDKDISSITSKLSSTATTTNMFSGNTSIDTSIVSTIQQSLSSSDDTGDRGIVGEDDSEETDSDYLCLTWLGSYGDSWPGSSNTGWNSYANPNGKYINTNTQKNGRDKYKHESHNYFINYDGDGAGGGYTFFKGSNESMFYTNTDYHIAPSESRNAITDYNWSQPNDYINIIESSQSSSCLNLLSMIFTLFSPHPPLAIQC